MDSEGLETALWVLTGVATVILFLVAVLAQDEDLKVSAALSIVITPCVMPALIKLVQSNSRGDASCTSPRTS